MEREACGKESGTTYQFPALANPRCCDEHTVSARTTAAKQHKIKPSEGSAIISIVASEFRLTCKLRFPPHSPLHRVTSIRQTGKEDENTKSTAWLSSSWLK
eukprot:3416027-Rhodomonas_salina.2